jgi:PQQ-like domain
MRIDAWIARPAGFAAAIVAAVLLLAMLGGAVAPPDADAAKRKRAQRSVLYVGNNWDGTADVVSPHGRFRKLAHLNIVPDLEERMLEIYTDPVRLGYFLAIRELIGEGHDQFVDDIFSVNKGRWIVVSRPSLADVVAIDIASGEIVWRFAMTGQRADHMAISPDGRNVAVSDSTANVVHVLDTRTGEEQWSFPSGDSPHENNYSEDGRLIYHASIGMVYTPADGPEADTSKGDRFFEIVDTQTHEVIERLDMGQKLAEAGYPGMSSAVRPMAIAPGERFVYFQVSFFHGFVEYDFKQDRVRRVAELPISDAAKDIPKEQYLLDSAHHGLAMNPQGKRLCVAGTMSDYAAIVSRKSFRYKIINGGVKPYWSTNSGDGRYCFVSWSGSDRVSAISYRDRKEVARVPVGDHPQRMRMGVVSRAWLQTHR